MQTAREIYGDEFDVAYRCLVSLDEDDPMARLTVNIIWTSPDPGRRLMDWYRSNFVPVPTVH
jgi:hypothetical protein